MPTKKFSYEFLLSPQDEWTDGAWSNGSISITVGVLGGGNLCNIDMTFDVKGDYPLGVYGFDVTIKKGHIIDFEESVKIARRILKGVAESHSDSYARDVLDFLEKIATQVVYDSREGDLIPIDEAKPSSWSKYYDDYRALGESRAHFSAIAEDASRAGLDILQEAIEARKLAWAKNFVQHDMPVLPCRHTSMPDTTPAIDLLRDVGLIKDKEIVL